MKVRKDVNRKFYGYEVTAAQLLSGHTPVPPAAKSLYDALDEYSAWVTGINVMRQSRVGTGGSPPAQQNATPSQDGYGVAV